MGATAKLHISLPEDLARKVKDQVESGAFASESDVIRDALEASLGRDDEIEKWLRQEVLASIAEVAQDPESTVPADEVMERIRSNASRPG